jgi:ATP-dependent DNA ligase
MGGEGIVVKKYDHVYEPKRSNNWIKTKEERDCDLKIVDYYAGKGKREGYIGGLTCRSEDGELEVNVGSGLSDEQLYRISEVINTYIGTVVKITFNTTIVDKYGNLSLFLPRIKEFRSDKSEADFSNEIHSSSSA